MSEASVATLYGWQPQTPETATGLRALFEPRAIAVVGVSARRRGLGRRVFEGLQSCGFPGPIYAVTREGGEIDGRETWTRSS
jgi:acyl-CoA synthetase (NDP forming)